MDYHSIFTAAVKSVTGMKDDFEPLVIESYKHNQKENYNKIKLDGVLLDEHPSTVFNEYLDILVSDPEKIEKCHKSMWEIALNDALGKTYLCEGGFVVSDNQLLLFRDDKMHTVIRDIKAKVQGVIIITLSGEIDESIVVVCNDEVVLISEDFYYVDLDLKRKAV